MRRLLLAALLALGCPPPARYTVDRPGLPCDRATRLAYRTMVALGFSVTSLVPASPARVGEVAGTRDRPDGSREARRVQITCDARGAVLRPIEDELLPSYEFSRAFGYSFTTLVARPDVEEPRAARGLEVLVHVLDAHEALLDLGGVPTAPGYVAARVTVRNHTDRAVAVDPARIELVPADGDPASPVAGPALAAALGAGGAGAERVRAEYVTSGRIAPGATVAGYLVYPAARYREARIGIEDVETGETEGFVTPIE
jgi:hypothetical protein